MSHYTFLSLLTTVNYTEPLERKRLQLFNDIENKITSLHDKIIIQEPRICNFFNIPKTFNLNCNMSLYSLFKTFGHTLPETAIPYLFGLGHLKTKLYILAAPYRRLHVKVLGLVKSKHYIVLSEYQCPIA